MKTISVSKDPKEVFSKYKSDFGEYFDQLIEACVEWDKVCNTNMFYKQHLQTLLDSSVLQTMKQIDQELNESGNKNVLETFFIEMINGQYTNLVIPYMVVEGLLPDQYANTHIGLLGSASEIFEVIKESEFE